MKIKRKNIENEEMYLRQISKEVNLENKEYKEDIKTLKKYVEENSVYALASVQIGIPKRIIYIKNTTQDMELNKDKNYNEDIVLVNPEILESQGEQLFLEGCHSCKIKDKFLVCEVKRPYKIKVKYFDKEGIEKIEDFSDFKAVVLSHEMDHLDGILHIDRSEKIYKFTLEEMKEYRTKNPLKIIEKENPFVYDERKENWRNRIE